MMPHPDSVLLEMDRCDAEAILRYLAETRSTFYPWPDAIQRVYAYIDLQCAKARRDAINART